MINRRSRNGLAARGRNKGAKRTLKRQYSVKEQANISLSNERARKRTDFLFKEEKDRRKPV